MYKIRIQSLARKKFHSRHLFCFLSNERYFFGTPRNSNDTRSLNLHVGGYQSIGILRNYLCVRIWRGELWFIIERMKEKEACKCTSGTCSGKKKIKEIFNFILNRKKRLLYTILIGYQLFITPFLGITLYNQ